MLPLRRGGERSLQGRQIVSFAAFAGIENRQMVPISNAPVSASKSQGRRERNGRQPITNCTRDHVTLAGLQQRILLQIFEGAEPEEPVFDNRAAQRAGILRPIERWRGVTAFVGRG